MANVTVARTPEGRTETKGLQLEEVVKLRSVLRRTPCSPTCDHATCYQKVLYRVELDTMKLHAMARKAAGSKGGRAVDGPVVVTVVEG